MTQEEKIISALLHQEKTISVAESCTGGLLSQRLTKVPESSKTFIAGIVAYSNEAKIKILGLNKKTIASQGAVSEVVAEQMAQAARELFDTDFGLGITGIAGPSGGSKAKPVGLVYIAIATAVETLCLKCQFPGTRDQVRKQASTQALKLLQEFLG